MAFALVLGVGFTFGLLMLMSLLLTQRAWVVAKEPLWVVELTHWQTAADPVEHDDMLEREIFSAPEAVRVPEPKPALSPPVQSEAAVVVMDEAEAKPDVEPVEPQPRAQELVNRSLDWIRSQDWESGDATGLEALRPDPRTHAPVSNGLDEDVMDVYRLPNGNLKVRMKSLFGKIQCFEVPERDPLDEFSFGVWMVTRC